MLQLCNVYRSRIQVQDIRYRIQDSGTGTGPSAKNWIVEEDALANY